MEQAKKGTFFKYTAEGLLALLIAIGLLAAALIFPPAAVVLAVPLIFIWVRRGIFYSLFGAAVFCALVYLVAGTTGVIVFAALFFPPLVIISCTLSHKTRSFEAVVFSVAAFAVGIGLMSAFFFYVQRTDLITYLMRLLEGFMHANPGTAHQFIVLIDFQDVVTGVKNISAILAVPEAEAVKNALVSLRAMLQSSLPVLFSDYALLGGLLSYVTARAFLKKKGVAVAPIPAFSNFRLPKGFFVGMLIIAAILALGSLVQIPNFTAVFEASKAAYITVFTVCGLSFLDFLLKRRKMNSGARIAIMVISGLLVSFILVWIGLFDSLFRFKERIDRPEDFDGE